VTILQLGKLGVRLTILHCKTFHPTKLLQRPQNWKDSLEWYEEYFRSGSGLHPVADFGISSSKSLGPTTTILVNYVCNWTISCCYQFCKVFLEKLLMLQLVKKSCHVLTSLPLNLVTWIHPMCLHRIYLRSISTLSSNLCPGLMWDLKFSRSSKSQSSWFWHHTGIW